MKLAVISLMLYLFNNTPIPCDGGKVTITGKAVNSLGAAAVQADDGTILFLMDKESWNEKYLGKKVQVKGRAVKVTHQQESKPGEPVQEWVGTRCYIKRPRWKLAE